jgi:hypothetical protein
VPYREAVQQLAEPSIGSFVVERSAPKGPTNLLPEEAGALVYAVAVGCRELALRVEQEPTVDVAEASSVPGILTTGLASGIEVTCFGDLPRGGDTPRKYPG